jgi:hypothetical protein
MAAPEKTGDPRRAESALSQTILDVANEFAPRSAQPRGSYHALSTPGSLLAAPMPSAFASPDSLPPAHIPDRSLRIAKPGVLGLIANPQELISLQTPPQNGLARETVRPHHAGNIAALPGTGREQTPAPVAANMHGKPVTRVAQSTGKALVGAGALLNGKTFEVAFDSSKIAFDVPPRVESGLPLAPFRQIFEHTGGQVKWFGKSRTVLAVNSTREIEFHVGSKQAKVNNQPVAMETRSYLDHGRAIVPLSFIRDSLNVRVQYDPKTGHLLIESKK